MSSEPKTILLTSDALRHRFAARSLARACNLVGIVSEAKAPAVSAPTAPTPAEQAVFAQHFAERDAVERKLLGTDAAFPDTEVLPVKHGEANSVATFDWVQAREPEFILLYGSSIIKAPLLEHYDGRIINLHLGLSPYYRGSGTNFWPLVNREPECVGATLHLAVLAVDAGAILAQVRPAAERADRAHELGTKTLLAALALLPRVLKLYQTRQLQPQPQVLTQGRTYRQKDFTAAAVRTLWQNLASGMLAEYLAAAENRCQRYPLVELHQNNPGAASLPQ